MRLYAKVNNGKVEKGVGSDSLIELYLTDGKKIVGRLRLYVDENNNSIVEYLKGNTWYEIPKISEAKSETVN